MGRKVGEIFECNGEWYQCVEQPCEFDVAGCNLCAMSKIKNCDISKCSGQYRADGNSVIFKKLEKLGEPFTDNGKLYINAMKCLTSTALTHAAVSICTCLQATRNLYV